MNEKEVMKPATLLKDDFEKKLIELCNESGLPLFIIEYILKDVYVEVKTLAKKQYEADLVKYKSDLAECEQRKDCKQLG